MSFEDRFDENEQLLLVSIPSMIGSAMAFAEGSGLGTVKELMASAKSMMSGVKEYADNEIILGVLPNLENRKEAVAKAKAFREKAVERLKARGVKNHEQMRELLLEDCRAVTAVLAAKASAQEAEEYKQWAMSVAENVANAAKEGGFLGIGGRRISDGEKQLFRELAQTMGTSSDLA